MWRGPSDILGGPRFLLEGNHAMPATEEKAATPRDARQSPKGVLTRQRIVDAAASLLREHPGADVSISDIAARAGMSKGSIYYYFADSAQIVSQVLFDEFDALLTSFEKVALSSVSAYDALVGITRSYLVTLMGNVPLTRFVMGELHDTRGALPSQEGEPLVRRIYALVSTLLERGKVEGSVRSDVDSTVASPAILGAFLGISSLAATQPAVELERLVKSLLSFIGFGVADASRYEDLLATF